MIRYFFYTIFLFVLVSCGKILTPVCVGSIGKSKDNMPIDVIFNLRGEQSLQAFRYLPDQSMWEPGIITHQEFYISPDGIHWTLVDQAEFSNIKNNLFGKPESLLL